MYINVKHISVVNNTFLCYSVCLSKRILGYVFVQICMVNNNQKGCARQKSNKTNSLCKWGPQRKANISFRTSK